MALSVYSSRFSARTWNPGEDDTAFTVDPGYVAVLRCVTINNLGSDAPVVVYVDYVTGPGSPSSAVILAPLVGPDGATWGTWDLHVVLNEGDSLEVNNARSSDYVDVTLNGYLLSK